MNQWKVLTEVGSNLALCMTHRPRTCMLTALAICSQVDLVSRASAGEQEHQEVCVQCVLCNDEHGACSSAFQRRFSRSGGQRLPLVIDANRSLLSSWRGSTPSPDRLPQG